MSLTKEQKREYNRKYHETHKEKRRAYSRKYRLEHIDEINEYNRNYRKDYRKREIWTDRRLQYQYGINLEQFDEMLGLQENLCALCGDKMISSRVRCIDHDHKTGQIRGIICRDCNLMLGYAKENPAILGQGIEYINHWKSLAKEFLNESCYFGRDGCGNRPGNQRVWGQTELRH
jgi:hypothetical protein